VWCGVVWCGRITGSDSPSAQLGYRWLAGPRQGSPALKQQVDALGAAVGGVQTDVVGVRAAVEQQTRGLQDVLAELRAQRDRHPARRPSPLTPPTPQSTRIPCS
jgi:hypothetical protein